MLCYMIYYSEAAVAGLHDTTLEGTKGIPRNGGCK